MIKKTFNLWLLAAGLLVAAAQVAQAQNTTTIPADTTQAATAKAEQGSPALVRLSGCLQRGSGDGEYTLFGPTLHWWELKSDNADLAAHLNQEVTVTAVKSADDNGTFTVTAVNMESTSCRSW